MVDSDVDRMWIFFFIFENLMTIVSKIRLRLSESEKGIAL